VRVGGERAVTGRGVSLRAVGVYSVPDHVESPAQTTTTTAASSTATTARSC
jgi:hypothetical protein